MVRRVGDASYIYDNFNVPELMNYLGRPRLSLRTRTMCEFLHVLRHERQRRMLGRSCRGTRTGPSASKDGGSHLRHPYFGDQEHSKQNANQWNVLYDVVFETPDLTQMYLRRPVHADGSVFAK